MNFSRLSYRLYSLSIFIVLLSCEQSSSKGDDIRLNCEKRNWSVDVTIPIPQSFSEIDTLLEFWPIDPEAHQKIFKAHLTNTFIIIKYCESYFEGGDIGFITDIYHEKFQDANATELSLSQKSDFFISEHLIYHGFVKHEIYLATKVFQIKNDIVTIIGMSLEDFSDSIRNELYSIIQESKIFTGR